MFDDDVASMSRLAARDFEDILQVRTFVVDFLSNVIINVTIVDLVLYPRF